MYILNIRKVIKMRFIYTLRNVNYKNVIVYKEKELSTQVTWAVQLLRRPDTKQLVVCIDNTNVG